MNRLEMTTLESGVEGYAQLTPALVVDGGEALGLNLGAPVRLRLAGGKPAVGWVPPGGLGQPLGLGAIGACPQARVGHFSGRPGGASEGYSLISGHLVRHALAEGGTLLFAEGDGALRPGAFASLGQGVDHAR